EKQQEATAAYLDGMLSDRARLRFEQEMAQDAALRTQVEQLRLVKQSLRQLPQREVPRNFILDPAKQGRPARQPWVQAYPVLRTATAMAAFFFIFAVAAGIFTNFGAGQPLNVAPAADVALSEAVEEVEVTRVVTEAMESLAFEAEAVSDDAADEDAAEETSEQAVEEAGEAAAMVEAEAEMAEEAEEAPLPEVAATQPAIATTVPETADSTQTDSVEDGAESLQLKETPSATATVSPQPTPTASDLPRVMLPTPLPDRDPEQEEGGTTDNVAEAPEIKETEVGIEAVEETAVVNQSSRDDTPNQLGNPLPWLQIGLGLLLFLLLGLTFYARKQR
ncbi:MAG: hypothetical protein GY805_36165, partial [Chloroflexi bacterium]|nr:hypothetical protein [Chloroflexota bacterium]